MLDVDHFVSKVGGPDRFVKVYDRCIQHRQLKG